MSHHFFVDEDDEMELSEGHTHNTILVHGDQLSYHFAQGLADNWSQVSHLNKIAHSEKQIGFMTCCSHQ